MLFRSGGANDAVFGEEDGGSGCCRRAGRTHAAERANEATESQGRIEAASASFLSFLLPRVDHDFFAEPLLARGSPPTPLLGLPSPPTPTPQPSPPFATTPEPAHSIPTPTPAHAALVQHSDFVFKQFVKTIKDLNEANTTLRNSNRAFSSLSMAKLLADVCLAASLLMRLVGVNA